jgi:hypothetical protein
MSSGLSDAAIQKMNTVFPSIDFDCTEYTEHLNPSQSQPTFPMCSSENHKYTVKIEGPGTRTQKNVFCGLRYNCDDYTFINSKSSAGFRQRVVDRLPPFCNTPAPSGQSRHLQTFLRTTL